MEEERQVTAVPSDIVPGTHVPGFRESIDAVSADQDAFFRWFNNDASLVDATFSGAWDFSWHIAAPLARHLGRSVTADGGMTALEIGCGGGRMLGHAARMFPRVIGVDVHDHLDAVGRRLAEVGIDNVDLRRCDGLSLPCDDASVDVVYSFIVFQHLEKIAILIAYLRESFRVLKPGGLAMIYAGRQARLSLHRRSRLLLLCDLLLEPFSLPRGYREIPAAVNSTNLRVSRSFMRVRARGVGFQTIETCVSRRNIPQDTARFGGQHGFLLRKPS